MHICGILVDVLILILLPQTRAETECKLKITYMI